MVYSIVNDTVFDRACPGCWGVVLDGRFSISADPTVDTVAGTYQMTCQGAVFTLPGQTKYNLRVIAFSEKALAG